MIGPARLALGWCLGTSLVGSACATDLTAAVQRVKPSVVLLGTYDSLASPRFALHGSGFVVANGTQTHSNLAITNAHVVAAADDDTHATLVLQIGSNGQTWQIRQAHVLRTDAQHDLALLQFEGPPAPALQVHDSATVQEGQEVGFTGFPLGNALGFSPVTHAGLISSIAAAALPLPAAQLNGTAVHGLRQGNFNLFQIDGTAYPGNSGGPLFDAHTGEVLGVINMVLLRSTREAALAAPSGISYAVPSRYVLQLLQERSTQPSTAAPTAPTAP